MTTIPLGTASSPAGVDITTPGTAAAATMSMPNDGKTQLRMKTVGTTANFAAVPQSPVPDGGGNLSITPRAVPLAANKDYLAGPWPKGLYNDTNGNINFTFDAITAITVMAVPVTVPPSNA